VFVGNGSPAVVVEDSTMKRAKRNLQGCHTECDEGMLFCLARTRFHVALAQLGKTALSPTERQLLAPNDIDGGNNLRNMKIRNPIFLYEQTMLRNESTWDEMAQYLGVSHIPNSRYEAAKGKQFQGANICLPEYDYFRSQIMVYSYDLSVWLQKYLIPIAKDPRRTDVVIANLDAFEAMVSTFYRQDPCQRLLLDETAADATIQYVLDPSLNEAIWIPPQPAVIKKAVTRW
ncbi:MAG: hypothetical protein SGARI_007810, partial [Bacillariaceae sp.]